MDAVKQYYIKRFEGKWVAYNPLTKRPIYEHASEYTVQLKMLSWGYSAIPEK